MANVKFKLLCRKLGLPRPYVRGLLEVLWDVAHESGNPVLGDDDAVEAAAEWPGERGVLFAALRECRLIDQREDGAWEIHDYWHHAPDYVKGRTEREAERQKDKTCAHCGVVFHSPDARAEYCKSACRTAACRARKADPVTERNGVVRYGNGLLTDCNTTPSPSPSPSSPLPPKGGKRKKGSPDPAGEAPAQRVVDHYQAVVKPDQTKDRGVQNVTTLLNRGLTEEQLKTAADGYADFCRRKGREARYRTAVGNFYGKAAGYKEYLEYRPGERGARGRDIDAEVRALREKAAREEEGAKDGGGLLALASAVKANGRGGQP
jgi:hypothetical protein